MARCISILLVGTIAVGAVVAGVLLATDSGRVTFALAIAAAAIAAIGYGVCRAASSRRSKAADEGAAAMRTPEPVPMSVCDHLKADRIRLQTRVSAVEPLVSKLDSLTRLNARDSSELAALAHSIETLVPTWPMPMMGDIPGDPLGSMVVVARVVARRSAVCEAARLRTRAELLQVTLTRRDERLGQLARRVDTSVATLAPRVASWNDDNETSGCAGPALTLDTITGSTLRRFVSSLSASDLTKYPCEGLRDEITHHNHRVGHVAAGNGEQLEMLAALEAKIETLNQLAADIRAQWIPLRNEVDACGASWIEIQRRGRSLNAAGLLLVLSMGAVPTPTAETVGRCLDGEPAEVLTELSKQHCALQTMLSNVSAKLSGRARSLQAQIESAAGPLRTDGIDLHLKTSHCRARLSDQTTPLPRIARLESYAPGANRWDRAQTHLQKTGEAHVATEQIVRLLHDARSW